MAPSPECWSSFKLRALIVAIVAFVGVVFVNSPLFPWPELAKAGPRTTLIDMLICSLAVLVFAIGRAYKISGDRRVRWTVAQVVCGLILAFSTMAAVCEWILRQD